MTRQECNTIQKPVTYTVPENKCYDVENDVCVTVSRQECKTVQDKVETKVNVLEPSHSLDVCKKYVLTCLMCVRNIIFNLLFLINF